MATGNRSRYTQRPVQQQKSKNVVEPLNPGGAMQPQSEHNDPPVETKEQPATEQQSEPIETKQNDQTTPTTSPVSSDEATNDDEFYYNAWGHRVIKFGKPVTVRAKRIANRMVVCEDTVQEIPQQGSKRMSTHLVFFKGQEISESLLQTVGARKVASTQDVPLP